MSSGQGNSTSNALRAAGHQYPFALHIRHAGYSSGRVKRDTLHADPTGVLLHNAVLDACRRFARREAIVDSCAARRITYEEYGSLVETAAKGLVAAGVRPGEIIAIYLPNCWEYAVAYHAATLAGAVPTLLNPGYREREVRFQLGDTGAAMLITDGTHISGIN